jgi:hypothetical protein
VRIVAIDLAAEQRRTTVAVYAFDRTQHNPDSVTELEQLGQADGGIPVSRFEVPAEQVDHFLNKAFKRVLIRLVAQPIDDHLLLIDDSETSEPLGTPAQR